MQPDMTSSLATASTSASRSSDSGLRRCSPQSALSTPSVAKGSVSMGSTAMMEVAPNAAGPIIVDVRSIALPAPSVATNNEQKAEKRRHEVYGYRVLPSADGEPIAIDSDEEGQCQVRNPHPSSLPGSFRAPRPAPGCSDFGHLTGIYEGHRSVPGCPKASKATNIRTAPIPGCDGRGHGSADRAHHRSLSGCRIATMENAQEEEEDQYSPVCPLERTGTLCTSARAVPVPGPDGVIQSYYIACEHVPPPSASR